MGCSSVAKKRGTNETQRSCSVATAIQPPSFCSLASGLRTSGRMDRNCQEGGETLVFFAKTLAIGRV